VGALLFGSVVAVGLGCQDAPPADRTESPPRPNVLLYVIDTLRADSLGVYGNTSIDTPRIDDFAREATLFENAFANASWTRPSIASILTGLYPIRHGTEERHACLPEQIPTLGEILADHGYETGLINTNPNVAPFFGFGRGFAKTEELYTRRQPGFVGDEELIEDSDQVTRRAIAWMKRASRPFFLVTLTVDPHYPYSPPQRFDRYGNVDQSPIIYDANGDAFFHRRRLRSLYDGEISFNDSSFGELVDFLRAQEMLDDSIVILTSDHGEEFWEIGERWGHGVSLAESSIHVPLIVRLPGAGPAAGARRTEAVQLVDLMPTILDLVGLPVPDDLDGRPLFRSSRILPPAPVFSSLDLAENRLLALRAFPWKLVLNRSSGASALFNLNSAAGEAGPVRSEQPAGAREARKRLTARLAVLAVLAARARPGDTSREVGREEMPDDIKDALRALGYLE
jgi:choline-sulfatase